MVSLSLLLFSLFPVWILGYVTKQSHRRGLRFQTAILGATLLHEIILVVFPVWYSVFTNFYLEGEMMLSVRPEDLLVVMTGEALFILCFAFGLMKGPGKRFDNILKRYQVNDRSDVAFLYVLVAIGSVIYLQFFLKPITDLSETISHSEGIYYEAISEMFFSWLRGFFQFGSLAAASLIVIAPRGQNYSRIFRWLAVGLLVAVSLLGLSAGMRGRILWVVCLLGIIGFTREKSKKPFLIGALLIMMIVPLFSFLGGAYRTIYYNEAKFGSSRLEMLKVLSDTATQRLSGKGFFEGIGIEFLHELAERTQASRNSCVLFQLHDDGVGAGVKPLLGAIVTVIPRIFWKDKPFGGSSDQSNYGLAVYVVRRVGYGSPIYNMGPYLASAHAYWEGGWIWVLFAGLLTGIIWKFIFRWYQTGNGSVSIIVALVYCGGVLSNGFLTALQPLYDYIRLFWTSVLPIILLNMAVKKLLERRNIPGQKPQTMPDRIWYPPKI